MILPKREIDEFEAAARPLIKWLCEFHPHVTAIVTGNHAELSEGICAIHIDDYIKD